MMAGMRRLVPAVLARWQHMRWGARSLQTNVALNHTDKPQAAVPYKPYEEDRYSSYNLPWSADVVVIGGGVLGCSTAYHLTQQGVQNVVLLEKDKLTAGTTWHTAGLVWSLRPSDTEVALLIKSKELMQRLEGETGVNTGWINNGGLFVAKSKVRLDEYKRLHTLGKAFGVESFILDPAETKKLYPLLNVEDLYGSLYSPADGTIDPAGYCTALSRGATSRGAKIVQNCAVTGIQTYVDDFGTRRVKSVETSQGTVQTDTVVNACGVWGAKIGAMAGVTVPLVGMKHAYVVTERIEGIRNMPNMRDHDASVYCKLQGDALSVGGYEPNPIFLDEVSDDFAFSLYELDWDVFSHNIGGAINRIPVIETTGVKSTVCGPESFTADHKPLLGEAPELRGFYLACGFNSAGMMHSIFAEELAKWIIQGRPELDMYDYDIRRFSTEYTRNMNWCKEGAHEAYAKSYSIIFPHDESLASRNLRQDALYQELLEAGCVYQQRQGWERPGWFTNDGPAPALPYDYYGYYGNNKHQDYLYGDKLDNDYSFDFPEHHSQIGRECLGCRNNVAVINMSYFGKFYLVGPDAQLAADWIFTNDMQKEPGQTIYTCMLNKHGGVELDLTVSVVEPGSGSPHSPQFEGVGFYLAMGGGAAQHGFSYIQNLIQDHKWSCQLLDHSEDMCLLSVQGPNSRAVLQKLTDTDLSNKSFPFGTHQILRIAGHEARALRISFVGELGWELHLPSHVAVETYKAMMEAGESLVIINAGYRAMDSLSLEKGYRMWHSDLRPDDDPLESGLTFTCKLQTDTAFIGRDAVEKSKAEGLKKRLAFFTLEEHIPLFGHEAIYRDDRCVGYLRRGDYAYHLDQPMGCGYVVADDDCVITTEFLRQGAYSVDSFGKLYPAQIHLRSPFDPTHQRIRGTY